MPKSLPIGFSQPKSAPKAVVYFGTLEEVALIARAAEQEGEAISAFLRTAALDRAKGILHEGTP